MRAKTRLALDIVLMIALVAAYRPEWTGVSLHQWLSIAIIAPLLLHVAVNWEWTIRVLRTFVERLLHVSRLNLVVDCALFLAAITVMLSGFMVSPALLSPLGIHLPQPALWNAVHLWSANITIAVFAVHGALHWRWVYRTATKLLGGSKKRGAASVSASQLATQSLQQTAVAGTPRRGSRVGVRAAQAKAERAAAARTLSVLGVTLVAGLTIFAGVGLASAVLPAAKQSNGQVAKAGLMTCPATGCAASTCHAQYGQSAKVFYASKPSSLASRARVAFAAKKQAPARKKTKATVTHTTAKRVVSAPVTKPKPAAPKSAPKPVKKPIVVASKPRVLVCPQTGCTQTSCHGTHHQSASSYYN